MFTSCYTNVTKDGRLIVNVVENDTQVKTRFATFYDMKEIEIPRNFQVPVENERNFVEALYTNQGRQLINRLKNQRVETLVNSFLSYYSKRINCPKTGKHLLGDFVDGIRREPLTGRNRMSFVTIGITKKQIFEALINEGLIK